MAECSGFSNNESHSLNLDTKIEGCGEGRLGKHLEKAFQTALKKQSKILSLSLLQEKYQEIHEANPDALKALHKQLIEQVETNTRNEFSRLCKDRKIGPLLDGLDEQIIKYNDNIGNKAWRPSGDPEEMVRDFFYDIIAKHKELLQKRLDKTNRENEELLAMVKKNHEELLAMRTGLADNIASHEEMNKALYKEATALEDHLCDLIDGEHLD